jgi:hypothetical protein
LILREHKLQGRGDVVNEWIYKQLRISGKPSEWAARITEVGGGKGRTVRTRLEMFGIISLQEL